MSNKLHGGSSSSATACAACKYQRKKCPNNCLLAPYFPQERYAQFLNAHKLFGISNITKMIKALEEPQRHVAMRNLIFHADARARDPVGGVYRIMCDLKRMIEFCQAELNLVLQQLSLCRSLAQQQQMQDLSFGCCSYDYDLLEQEDEHVNAGDYDLLEQEDEHVNAGDYDHQNVQEHHEMMKQQSPLDNEMFLEMPQQTTKLNLDK